MIEPKKKLKNKRLNKMEDKIKILLDVGVFNQATTASSDCGIQIREYHSLIRVLLELF